MAVSGKARGALLVLALSAATAAGLRATEELRVAEEASEALDFQGYCPRGVKCSAIKDGKLKDLCEIFVGGKTSPGFVVHWLENSKCVHGCSIEDLSNKCKALLQPLQAATVEQCVQQHNVNLNDYCNSWESFLKWGAKHAYKKFTQKSGLYVEGCYKQTANLGATLCTKYDTACPGDKRAEKDEKQCNEWKAGFTPLTDDEQETVWKDPMVLGRSLILSEATTDADKCLEAFHDAFTQMIVNPNFKEFDEDEMDKGWKWFKGGACKSLDSFLGGVDQPSKVMSKKAKVADKDVCTKGDKHENLVYIVCRAYAGFCTADEGSDLFKLEQSSLTGKIGDFEECSKIEWK